MAPIFQTKVVRDVTLRIFFITDVSGQPVASSLQTKVVKDVKMRSFVFTEV